MSEIWMDVDAALSEVPVNLVALIDDTDFKSREQSVTFDQSGLDLLWNFVTTAGAFTQTAVTPTDTAGDYDWVNQGNGYYTIEIPATGGASANNDTEGFGFFSGFATGVLPWRGPVIGFRAAGLNNTLIDSAFSATRGLAGTALPAAVADAAGGLIISDAGGLDADATDANISTLLDALIMQATTIATLASQVSFTLTAGSADDDAYEGATIVVVDQSTGVQKAFGSLSAYTGSSKTVTLAQDPGVFTMATGDIVYVLPSDVFAIWDRLLSGQTHNINNSAGKRLRQLVESGNYANGLVWLDTNVANTGSTDFQDGTEVNPTSLIASVNTILSSLPLHGCHVAAGSAVTFPAAQDNQEWTGEGWTLALNGKSIAGTTIIDATISGISIGVPDALRSCFINGSTFAGGDFITCALGGILKLSGATMYHFFDCHHARSAALSEIDFDAAVGAQEVHIHNWHGNLIIKNMKAGDVLHFTSPDGALTLDTSCTAGTVNLAGVFGLTNNGSGQTINDIGVGSLASVTDAVLADTANMQPKLGSPAGASISADILVIDNFVDGIESTLGTPAGASMSADILVIDNFVDGIESTLGVAGAGLTDLGGMSTAMKAEIFAAAVQTQMTEGYAADGVAPTMEQSMFLQQQAMTEFAIVTTTLTIKKLDGSTTAAVLTLDDATSPTSKTRTS